MPPTWSMICYSEKTWLMKLKLNKEILLTILLWATDSCQIERMQLSFNFDTTISIYLSLLKVFKIRLLKFFSSYHTITCKISFTIYSWSSYSYSLIISAAFLFEKFHFCCIICNQFLPGGTRISFKFQLNSTCRLRKANGIKNVKEIEKLIWKSYWTKHIR